MIDFIDQDAVAKKAKTAVARNALDVSDQEAVRAQGILKTYIPDFLYKPPFGYPRKDNVPLLRDLSTTPYVFSVMKTLSDEASSLDWEIKLKDDVEDPEKWEDRLKIAKDFFKNPNSNEESWEHIQRCLIRDIIELDSGIIVKVFNRRGVFAEMYARDGGSFLKNTDIFGTIRTREEFVLPVDVFFARPLQELNEHMINNYYTTTLLKQAAYFQYGWTAGSMPVPFGKREVVYIMQNPRSDSIYGRSPVAVLADVIMVLHYGEVFHLDYYLRSNIPQGIVSIAGGDVDEVRALQERFNDEITVKDALGNNRRIGTKIPFTSSESVAFTPFTLAPKELEIIKQQEWWTKIVWMSFGVTPDEMGITEHSNRAISQEQSKVFKRKAIRPICSVLKYHVDTQILPEFVADLFENWDEAIRECPFEFVYLDYDQEEDLKKHNILKMQLEMGVKTPEMVAEELGINVEELKKSKEENETRMMERAEKFNKVKNDDPDDEGKEEEEEEDNPGNPGDDEYPGKKARSPEQMLEKELNDFISGVGKKVENLVKEGL